MKGKFKLDFRVQYKFAFEITEARVLLLEVGIHHVPSEVSFTKLVIFVRSKLIFETHAIQNISIKLLNQYLFIRSVKYSVITHNNAEMLVNIWNIKLILETT